LNEMTKNILLWVVIGIILMSVFSNFTPTSSQKDMSYSDFIQSVERGSIGEVKIEGREKKAAMIESIIQQTECVHVQTIGHIGIFYRKNVKNPVIELPKK